MYKYINIYYNASLLSTHNSKSYQDSRLHISMHCIVLIQISTIIQFYVMYLEIKISVSLNFILRGTSNVILSGPSF